MVQMCVSGWSARWFNDKEMQRLYYSGQLNTLRLFSSPSQTFATTSSGLIPFGFQLFMLHLHLGHPCFSSSHKDSPNSSSSSTHLTPLPFPSFLFELLAISSTYTSLHFLNSRSLSFHSNLDICSFALFLSRSRPFRSLRPPPLSASYEHQFHPSWITIPRNTIIELATNPFSI